MKTVYFTAYKFTPFPKGMYRNILNVYAINY